jgi:hypothetical protein
MKLDTYAHYKDMVTKIKGGKTIRRQKDMPISSPTGGQRK